MRGIQTGRITQERKLVVTGEVRLKKRFWFPIDRIVRKALQKVLNSKAPNV